jgi:hypothetical protein
MRSRIAAWPAVALVAALVAWPGGAVAHKAKYESIVEISAYLDSGAFLGSVGSFDNKRCSLNRVVTVWRRNPGAMNGPFGTARSGRGGQWRLTVSAPPGTYFATVKRRLLRHSHRHRHRHICRAARSSRFTMPD